MSDGPLATFYVIAFGPPRPLHKLLLQNWAACEFADFVLLTDEASPWLKIIPRSAFNISVSDVRVPEYFARAYPFLGVDSATAFQERFGFLYHPESGPMNGWTACGMRPMLRRLFPRRETPFWGWLDYDVMLNPKALRAHIDANSACDCLLFPETGGQWEQCKLFNRQFDLEGAYLEMALRHAANRTPANAPLEARIIYDLRILPRDRFDNIPQSRLASHWAFSDRTPNLPNQYDVRLSGVDMSMRGPAGQEPFVFIADTQTKRFGEEESAHALAGLREGEFCFAYRSAVESGAK